MSRPHFHQVPAPPRRRLLRGWLVSHPHRLRHEDTWFIQGGIQFDYFEAIEEALDLHRNSMGHVKHIHIARADEVLLW